MTTREILMAQGFGKSLSRFDEEKAYLDKWGHWRIMGRGEFQPRTLHEYEGKPVWANTGYQG